MLAMLAQEMRGKLKTGFAEQRSVSTRTESFLSFSWSIVVFTSIRDL